MKLIQSIPITNEEANEFILNTSTLMASGPLLYNDLKRFNFDQHELLSILNLRPDYITLFSIIPDIERRFTEQDIRAILEVIDKCNLDHIDIE